MPVRQVTKAARRVTDKIRKVAISRLSALTQSNEKVTFLAITSTKILHIFSSASNSLTRSSITMVARKAKKHWNAHSKRRVQLALSLRQLRWSMPTLWRLRMPLTRLTSQTMPLRDHRLQWQRQSRRTMSMSRSYKTIKLSASESRWSLLGTSIMLCHRMQLCPWKIEWELAYGRRTFLQLT